MLHPLHLEFPMLWVIVFFPWGAFFLKGVSPDYFCKKHLRCNWYRSYTFGSTFFRQAEAGRGGGGRGERRILPKKLPSEVTRKDTMLEILTNLTLMLPNYLCYLSTAF